MGRKRLTNPPHFHLEYFDPPAALEPYVLTLFHFVWDAEEIVDKQPGALGQVVLFPYGEGSVELAGERHEIAGDAHIMSGFSVAGPFRIKGPWHAYGASLSPLGWAALTGRPASDYIDRFLPADQLLGEGFADFARNLNEQYRTNQIDGKSAGEALAGWMLPHLQTVSQPHQNLIETTLAWLGKDLNPDLDDLFSQISYSRRQAERLVERYFGFPPAALARKYRAVRASALLSQPDLSDHAEAIIAEAFYDQPHMVREIRRYCCDTPSRLGGEENPILQTMLRMKNFRRLQMFQGLE